MLMVVGKKDASDGWGYFFQKEGRLKDSDSRVMTGFFEITGCGLFIV